MKPPPRKLSVFEQLEEHARKTKYTVFFCAALFCCVFVIAAGFKVVGWQASRAENQKQERQKIHKREKFDRETKRLRREMDEYRKQKTQ